MLQAVKSGDARAVHRARVASRRLREVLPVLQGDPDVIDKLSRRLKKITKRLGKVREVDVLLDVMNRLKAVERYPDAALTRIAASVEQERGPTRDRHLAKSQIRELRRVADKLEKFGRSLEESDSRRRDQSPSGRAATVAERRACRWAIQARVGRRAATFAGAIEGAGAVYLPERLHAVRIAGKKLRYALELDADLASIKSSPALTQLRRVQNILGRLHDLQVLIDRARGEQASLTPPDINVWRGLDELVGLLENDCRRLHGRYMHEAASLVSLCSRLTGRLEEGTHKKLEARAQKSDVRR